MGKFTKLRYPDWTERWSRFIQESLELASDLSLDWEHVNCSSFTGQGIEALTGENPYDQFAGFQDAMGAAKAIRSAGYRDLDELVADFFDEIPLAYIWPGDIVMVNAPLVIGGETSEVMPRGLTLADPPFFYAVTPEGLGKGDLYKDGVKAFAVGRII